MVILCPPLPCSRLKRLACVHVQESHLWLTREMTFNSMDRIVPIRSAVQVSIINEFNLLTQNQHTLIEVHGYRALCFIWHKALKALRIPTKRSCRYLYAQLAYQQLIATHGKNEVKKSRAVRLGEIVNPNLASSFLTSEASPCSKAKGIAH